ncbi:hypothetical protein JW949_02155 [Candidatus Woesearchaeota archaeon]|nr:hypothetical protein [Candidatus Woesearchaeota archaeon]
MEKKQIILDTNFLLIPEQFNVDIFKEIDRIINYPYGLYIVEGTEKELEKIKKEGNQKDKRAVNIALKLIEQKNLKTHPDSDKKTEDSVDDLIVEKARDYVATQDKELKKRLKKKKIRIITLKQKKYLNIE